MQVARSVLDCATVICKLRNERIPRWIYNWLADERFPKLLSDLVLKLETDRHRFFTKDQKQPKFALSIIISWNGCFLFQT